jgi:hypothetical protein
MRERIHLSMIEMAVTHLHLYLLFPFRRGDSSLVVVLSPLEWGMPLWATSVSTPSVGSYSRVRCKGSNACFRCGRKGYLAREYPLVTARILGSQVGDPQSGQAIPVRVHSLSLSNVEDGANAANAATGTIPLFCGIACIWFDLILFDMVSWVSPTLVSHMYWCSYAWLALNP